MKKKLISFALMALLLGAPAAAYAQSDASAAGKARTEQSFRKDKKDKKGKKSKKSDRKFRKGDCKSAECAKLNCKSPRDCKSDSCIRALREQRNDSVRTARREAREAALFEGITLTPAQKSEIQALNAQTRAEMKALKAEARAGRDSLKAEARKMRSEAAKDGRMLSGKAAKQQAKGERKAMKVKAGVERKMQYLDKMEKILTPEQYLRYLENSYANK